MPQPACHTKGSPTGKPSGPLKPGEYEFVGEYHEKTAIGKLIVK